MSLTRWTPIMEKKSTDKPTKSSVTILNAQDIPKFSIDLNYHDKIYKYDNSHLLKLSKLIQAYATIYENHKNFKGPITQNLKPYNFNSIFNPRCKCFRTIFCQCPNCKHNPTLNKIITYGDDIIIYLHKLK